MGLASSEGLGSTAGGGAPSLRVPKATFTLFPKRDPERATWAVTVILRPLTIVDKAATAPLADGGGLQELTDKPCSEGHSCLPRSADLRRQNVDLLLHDRRALLRVVLPATVQVNERRRLLAAMPRCGCLILGAVRRTFCRRRHGVSCVMPNV